MEEDGGGWRRMEDGGGWMDVIIGGKDRNTDNKVSVEECTFHLFNRCISDTWTTKQHLQVESHHSRMGNIYIKSTNVSRQIDALLQRRNSM